MDNIPRQIFSIFSIQSFSFFQSGFTYDEMFLLIFNSILLFVLLFVSALFSASENSFFSLNNSQKLQLKNDIENNPKMTYLFMNPKRLLATILILNNLVNVWLILISTSILHTLFHPELSMVWQFVFQLFLVAFLLLIFGEIIPKIYASHYNVKTVKLMSPILYFFATQFPINILANLLEKSSTLIDKKLNKKHVLFSKDDLNDAIELAAKDKNNDEERELLFGIVNFGNLSAKQIMCSRMDIVAFEADISFKQILENINEHGYSRIPIYSENIDNIIGILNIKDLIPYTNEDENFDWKSLLRKPFYVHENKKLDDLLKEFKEKHIHFGIVVDEYGGTEGIVTMEDLMEEIVGDINDEFDEDESDYKKIDDKTFIFEGPILLNDFYRFVDIDGAEIEAIKGDAETLAGFLIEIIGQVPQTGFKTNFKNIEFIIEAADKRKIKKVKVKLR